MWFAANKGVVMRHGTGKVIATERGYDLVLSREFPISVEELWKHVTESELTAAWFGPWEGEGKPGSTVMVTMAFEEAGPPIGIRVEACEAPERLELRADDDFGSWHLELFLEASDEGSRLKFVHHLDESANVGDVGPGWEYYLDLLMVAVARASSEGSAEGDDIEQPEFSQYYPSQSAYYLDQL